MISDLRNQLIKDIRDQELEVNKCKFKYIQFLMAFIPDKDLASIYESYNVIFPVISQMSEQELLHNEHILNRIIQIFERWIHQNYNITLDYTNK